MWEKDIQLEELNTENSASYEEICERYVLSHVPKACLGKWITKK